ncbi:hypothetical protein TNCV_1110251 [Trichonephila clavipes]|nr:hypothetical protein TNCV_1110251 [Trichonephila clavipes]
MEEDREDKRKKKGELYDQIFRREMEQLRVYGVRFQTDSIKCGNIVTAVSQEFRNDLYANVTLNGSHGSISSINEFNSELEMEN